MLQAAVFLSFLRKILRFSTTSRPEALGTCYAASWQLLLAANPTLWSHPAQD
jgi:hypothetical protein